MNSPDWRQEPATENQISYLRSFGIEPTPGLTKGNASDLLEKATKDPVALERQAELRARQYEQERQDEIKFPSFYLRRMIESAREELDQARGEKGATKTELACLRRRLAAAEQRQERDLLNDAIVDEIQAIKAEIKAVGGTGDASPPDYVNDAQDELKNCVALRNNFWKSTFSKYGAVMIDSADLIDYVDTIDRLHDQFGRYFKTPTNKQISGILDALDKASPDWDKKEPHAFYATLKASFSNALRKNPARPTNPVSKGSGCLLLASLIFPALYVLILFLR
jgi:multidrug efflux pump subunit AcrA (membrane-fusion protein)